MISQASPAPVPSVAEVLRVQYESCLPHSLDDLTGPDKGAVALPLHIVWSGLRTYDLDRPRQRMSLYRTVLAEGQREDLVTFLNHNLLLAQWPVLRTLISRHIVAVWESAFPELGEQVDTAA